MIEFDEYKVKLNNIHPKVKELASSLNIEECKVDLDRLHAQIESDGFWENTDTAQKVTRQASQLEAKIERYEKMCTHWDDLMTICEMAIEENDDSMLDELVEGARAVKAANPDALPFEGPGVSSFRSAWMTLPFNTAFSGWGYHYEKDAYINEWVGDNIVSCLNWAKTLLEEGLLDPEFVTTNNDMDNTKKAERSVLVYYGNMGSIRVWLQRVNNAGNGAAKLMPVNLRYADGVGVDSLKLFSPTVGGYCFGINYGAGGEKLDGIVRFLEAAYSDEVRALSSYGREGEEHEVVDGTIVPILPNATDNAWISIYGWCSFNSNEKINWLQSIVIQQTAVKMSEQEKLDYQNALETAVWTLADELRAGMGVSPVAAIGALDDTTGSLAAEAREQQLSLFAKALMSEISVEEFVERKDALVEKYRSVTDAYNALYAALAK